MRYSATPQRMESSPRRLASLDLAVVMNYTSHRFFPVQAVHHDQDLGFAVDARCDPSRVNV
jgi:hypothetical protein